MYDEIENVTLNCQILDSVPVGLCMLRSDWIVLFWNRHLERHTNIAKSEIVGSSLLVHFNQLNPKPFEYYWYKIFKDREEVHFSVLLNPEKNSHSPAQKLSGSEQVTLTPISAIAGEEIYALLTLRPPVPPNNGCDALTLSDEQQGELEQLIDRIAHDLGEPLRMVVNFGELLAQRYSEQLDSTGKKMIFFAVDGARRMQEMIDGLLMYSRLKSRYQPPQPIDAQTALEQTMMDLESLIVKTEAQITATPLPRVMADRQKLAQVFSILIENAIKYRGDRPPKIQITARPQADVWEFSVRDNGIGIDAKSHRDILKIFHRLHSRQDYPGIGMGLAIAKRIVELYGGRIRV